MLEGLAFVAGWVAIGYIFDLGKTLNRQCVYLLIGIPLTIVFQLVIASDRSASSGFEAVPG